MQLGQVTAREASRPLRVMVTVVAAVMATKLDRRSSLDDSRPMHTALTDTMPLMLLNAGKVVIRI